ncbi:unnamed protein product [Brachionus calyciflorus]|uniref:Rab-GAP TBC domain-containing protein n=1 Tax=Brachionus calyciflorus TaxID=104777 RepID=A0A813M7R5_9BILA|nr:unnamed protein product [Brachionus calyciflorus]
MSNHAGKNNSVKFIDSVDAYDDDSDSLGSVLSDYNNIFYDAPTIEEPKNSEIDFGNFRTSKLCIDDSIDTSLNEPSDEEDSFILDDENMTFSLDEDKLIEKEFNDYLDDEHEILSEANEEKKRKIDQLNSIELNFDNYDLIRKMAIEKYGFVSKNFRRKAWPILILHKIKSLGSPDLIMNSFISIYENMTESQIKNNKYYNQVTLDVVRTLKRFPPEISDKLRLKLQDQLIDLICKILIKHDNLHYYQGYHDICITFLLVAGVQNCLPLIENLTLTHLTCYMESTMESTMKLLFNIMPLIDKLDPQVAEHIQRAELGVIFGLSWLITWYSHVMENLKIILRLYDFFIATDPLMPIYLGAIIVADKADVILEIDCDMASLHTVISKFPSKLNSSEQIENYIKSALKLFETYPPSSLPELNEQWLIKCQLILQQEEERRFQREQEEEMYLRQRKKNKTNDTDNKNNKVAKRKNLNMIRFRDGKSKANKFLFGLTFTVGVAAVAMYALNSNGIKDTPDLFSRFYQILSLKEF